MKTIKLNTKFFSKNTLWVAENLLGKYLCRRLPSSKVLRGMICETEAYRGFDDKASHAHKGRTKRTEVMFAPAGTIYVYLIYGMYHCLNIVTEKKDYPSAVLIRGIVGVNGPGRLCRHFNITRNLNGKMLGRELWIEEIGGQKPPPYPQRARIKVQKLKRVGVGYAEESKDWLWRFMLQSE